jgi:hypothetical protein
MIFDKTQLMLSDQQAVTATAISENVIKQNVNTAPRNETAGAALDIGDGTPVPLLVQVTEDFATLTSLTITLESSANADLSSSDVHWSSGAIAAADLVAGFKVPITYLPRKMAGVHYGLRYTVGGSNATAGKITAGVTMGIPT